MGDTIVIETPVATVLEVSGKQGPQGAQGPKGDPGDIAGEIAWANITGKPSTFAPSSHTHPINDVTGLQTALDAKQASGNYATLVSGKVPSDQLPSFVDDVLEYANLAAFPVTGESGKIYVSIDTRKTYRWSGSAYVEISPSEVTSVAGRTGAVTLAVADVSDAVPTSRTISAGAGLTGGGNLTADRTLAVSYGTTSGTACQGNDSRLSDSRTPTAHAASHAAGTKAEFNDQVAGMTEDVFIKAVTAGTAGNSITLTFDGIDDIFTVLSAWNTANPSNQASLISGNDQQIPDNGEEITLSGGVAGGSDPFKNINQDLGTTDEVAFAKLTLTAPANGEVIRIEGVGADANDVGFAVYNNTGDKANSFYFNQASQYVGIGVDAGEGYIQANVPLALPNIKDSLVIRDSDGGQTATFDANANLTANRTYDLPDASGTLALTSDIHALGTGAGEAAEGNHGHGNLTSDGKLGSTAGLPVVTTTAGAVTTLALGTANQVLRVNSGATGVEFADPAASGVTSVTGTAPIVSSGGTTPAISVTVGTTANTVAAGDDSRITGAAQKSANLSDLASASTARTNLGLGSAATAATGDFAAASHTHELTALAATGATNGHVLTANGSNGATFAALPASGVTGAAASASDVLGVSGANITGVDAGSADRLVFWDDSASKLTYLEAGSGLSISGTTLSATASGGSKTYAVFSAEHNQPPSTAFATLDTRNSIAVLDFDDATDESAVFVSIIPEGASLGSGLKIRLHWMATTATSGNVVWAVSLERMTTDLDSDSFDTIASGTAAANGTSGILTVTEITLTTIDSVTAGDGYRLKVTRDANNASDTMTGDAELVVCEVRSAA